MCEKMNVMICVSSNPQRHVHGGLNVCDSSCRNLHAYFCINLCLYLCLFLVSMLLYMLRGSVLSVFVFSRVACDPRPVWTYFILDHCIQRHAPWILNTLYVPALTQGKPMWPGRGQKPSRGLCVRRTLMGPLGRCKEKGMWWCGCVACSWDRDSGAKEKNLTDIETELRLSISLLRDLERECVLLLYRVYHKAFSSQSVITETWQTQ